MKMKIASKITILISSILLSIGGASAQTFSVDVDSLQTQPAIDSTLIGANVLAGLEVNQSRQMQQTLSEYTVNNMSRPFVGYRIRVFHDNSRSARSTSENIAKTIEKQYPTLPVYRSFDSPNFVVTVGDFRSKDEAVRLYAQLKKTYPYALIIKENINYPLVDADAIFSK